MKKYVLTVALVFGLFAFDMESCFAESAIIPGYSSVSGSGIWSVADLSSAVFKPTQYDTDRCVAVCVKEESGSSGRTRSLGVWYFMYYGKSNKVGVKTNNSSDFTIIEEDLLDTHKFMHNFMMELIDAAEANSKR